MMDEWTEEKSEQLERRKLELLQLARKSRIKWILDAREKKKKQDKKSNSTLALSESMKAKFPAAESIQNVISFLSDLAEDEEEYDLHSILMDIIDYDEFEDSTVDINNPSEDANSYEVFIKKLLHPNSLEIVKSMQKFVAKISKDINEAHLEQQINTSIHETKDWSSSIWSFLDFLFEHMRNCSLWKNETVEEFNQSKLDCEKFLFIKLHPLIFGTDIEDVHLNEQTRERIDALSFLTAEHLDIKSMQSAFIQQKFHQFVHQRNKKKTPKSGNENVEFLKNLLKPAISHLLDLEFSFSPTDKLNCLKRSSLEIAQILKDCRYDGKLPGADEFLPMMILVMKSGNPAHLHSNLKYLQRYTRPNKLVTEVGYLLTNFVSAVYFLDNVDANALTIDPDEFDKCILQAKQTAKSNLLKSRNTEINKFSYEPKQGLGSKTRDLEQVEAEFNVEELMLNYRKEKDFSKRMEFIPIQKISKRDFSLLR